MPEPPPGLPPPELPPPQLPPPDEPPPEGAGADETGPAPRAPPASPPPPRAPPPAPAPAAPWPPPPPPPFGSCAYAPGTEAATSATASAKTNTPRAVVRFMAGVPFRSPVLQLRCQGRLPGLSRKSTLRSASCPVRMPSNCCSRPVFLTLFTGTVSSQACGGFEPAARTGAESAASGRVSGTGYDLASMHPRDNDSGGPAPGPGGSGQRRPGHPR